jgi:hypothetical protein
MCFFSAGYLSCGMKCAEPSDLTEEGGLLPLSPPKTKLNGEQRISEVIRPLEALRDPAEVQRLLDLKGKADMYFCEMNQFLDAYPKCRFFVCLLNLAIPGNSSTAKAILETAGEIFSYLPLLNI